MFPQTSAMRENLGQWVGKAASPLMNLGNTIREAGILPGGISFYANVIPARHAPSSLQTLAQRLSGKGLVRMAPGLWREEQSMLPDLLSCSVRFHVSPPKEEPEADAQDLILFSARSPWTFAVDSVKTDQSNYLLNKYYGLWPFEIDGVPDFQIRITPNTKPMDGADRNERMRRSVENGGVDLVLEICGASTSNQWTPLVELRLEQEAEINETKVNFWPFHNGLGFKPEGLMNFLRPMPAKLTHMARQSISEATGTMRKTGEAAAETTDRAASAAGKAAANAQKATANAADQALNAAEESADKARGMASMALHRVSSTVSEVSSRAREVASTATSKAANLVSEMRGKTRRAVHDAEDQAAKAINGVANKARAVTGKTRKAAKQASDQATQVAQKATKKAQDTAARAVNAADEARETLNDVSGRVAKGATRAANEASDAATDISKRASKAAKRTADETTSTVTDVKHRVQEGNNSKH